MNVFKSLMVATCMMTVAHGAAAFAPDTGPEVKKPDTQKPAGSLNDDVRKGLGLDPLLDDLIPADDAQRGKPAPQQKPAAKDDLDQQLLEGLMEGEDIGAPSDPLVRVGQRMRQAGELIGKNKSGEQTQELQKRILEDIEQLLKQARQQQQQQQNANQQQQQSAKRETVKQSQPGQSETQSKQPGQQSTERLGKSNVQRPDPGQVNDMIKSIWGQLPGRAKEQMLWNANDEFLPKYELMIEEYFKSLVERQQRK